MKIKSLSRGLSTFSMLFLLSQATSNNTQTPTTTTRHEPTTSNNTQTPTTTTRHEPTTSNNTQTPRTTTRHEPTTSSNTQTPTTTTRREPTTSSNRAPPSTSTRRQSTISANTSTLASLKSPEPRSECFNEKSDQSIRWIYHEGYCYSEETISNFTYETGNIFCKTNGATLTSVHSDNEMDFIRSLTQGYRHPFLIGLRMTYGSELKWEDGTPVDYLHWSHVSDDLKDDEDYDSDFSSSGDHVIHDVCMSFSPLTGMWQKSSCDGMFGVICKFKYSSVELLSTTAAPRTVTGFCPDEWYNFGDKCYKVLGQTIQQQKGFFAAEQQCESMDSTLVSIHSHEEQNFLNGLVLDTRSKILIGLRRESSREAFKWADNSSLDYSNWNKGEPNNHLNTEENCVQILYSYTDDSGKWNDVPCHLKFPYICQKYTNPMITKPGVDPSVCTEPSGWIKIRTSCYQIFYQRGSPTTWLEAESVCEEYGGKLATLKSFDVTAELRRRMTELEGYFWIGLKTTAKHKYVWVGGSPLIYSNWQSDQPSEVSRDYNCVAVNTEGEWMVWNCNESLPYICEVSSEEAPKPTTVLPHHPNMTCPDTSLKWHDFDEKYCYIIEVKEKVTWYEASCRCTKEGGYLTSFHSSHELNVILHHLRGIQMPVHIGFERDPHGHFLWADGSPVDFTNWNSGQPSSKAEQCTEMHTATGKWNDIQCVEEYGYICSTLKVQIKEEPLPETEKQSGGSMSAGTITLIVICVLAVLAVLAVALYYVYPTSKKNSGDQTPFAKLRAKE